ncbi:MAG: molecular chaperone TorD family protein [Chloroflexota bacterium]|nr:molecular chaperone TorD family protein [Chloroflexota bacterium]
MTSPSATAELSQPVVEALARAGVYGLLARAFLYRAEGSDDLLTAAELAEGLRQSLDLLPVTEGLRREATSLGRALEGKGDRDLAAALGLLSHAHTATGLPYETEYTVTDVFLKAHQLADVAGFYRAFGLEVGGERHERPDHLAVELEFMYFLALKEAHACRSGHAEGAEICIDAQKKFLQDHLGRWLNVFQEQLRLSGAGRIYRALVRLAGRYVSWDARRLGARPRRVRAAAKVAVKPTLDASCPAASAGPCEQAGPYLPEQGGE